MVSSEYAAELELVLEIDLEIELVGLGAFILMGKYLASFLVCQSYEYFLMEIEPDSGFFRT